MPRSSSDDAWRVLLRLDSYFGLAGLKAGLVLPANAVLLGVSVAGVYQISASTGMQSLPLVLKGLISCVLLSALASSVCALVVTSAFLDDGSAGDGYRSRVFFGSIKNMSCEDLIETYEGEDQGDRTDDVLRQVHLLSGALHQKYVWMNWAVGLSAFGYALLVVSAMTMVWAV